MTSLLDFTPVFSETLARIRARMDADVNAGVLPGDQAYIDTREGSFYWDMTQVAALEIARIWDALATETVAAAFPSVAWGPYLDEHSATFALTRNPAISAGGFAQFNGSPGLLIASGTLIAAPPSDPSQDAITFQVISSGTTSARILAPTGVAAAPATTGGSLPPATYIYHVTSYNAYGESLGSADVPAIVTTVTGEVSVTWSAVTGAIGYRVYRTLIVGGVGGLIADLNITSFLDRGIVAPSTPEPSQNSTSGVVVPITAVVPGSAGNLAAGAISNMETLLPLVTAITNPAATTGGADVEGDEALRLRLLAQYTGQGAGNVNDYVRWALTATGVERAICIPIWAGAGTVLVVPMQSDGSPVASIVVTALQQQLDPTPGLGHGQAPIGATVTVATSVVLTVNISATIVFGTGFSLDGGGGTIATRAEIVAAINAYLMPLNPGDTIGFQKLQGAILTVEGVAIVNALLINGAGVDIVLTITPPQVPHLATPVLS